MAKDNELIIRINGDIKGYRDALEKTEKETKNLQNTFNTLAKTGAVAFAGFTAVIALSTAQFAEFDNGLRAVKTLLDETSFSAKSLDEGFQELSGDALGALTEFPVTLQAVNKSLFDIVSAGIAAEKSISVLGSTSRLAVAGITSAAVATDGVTSALNSYGLEAEQAELVAAKFFTAQKFGKTTIEELSNFMGMAASTAREFGISLDELLASTAAATTGGIRTRQAFTSLVAAMANVARPTEEAREEAERLGIEFNSTALRAKGLKGFLDDLTNSQNFNKQSIEKLFGSVEAQKIIYSLTGAQADKFKQTLDALSDSQQILTTFSRAYEEQSQSLKNQLVILQNNFQALGIIIGKDLAPIVETGAGIMTDFLRFLQDNPALADFISKIIIAGTVTAGLTTVLGLAGLAFLKLRAAMIASTVATNALRWAVKGLIGSTGIGLLIAFLPEIIELWQKFFGDTNKIAEQGISKQKKLLLQQSKDEHEIAAARTKGLSEIEIGFLKRHQEIRKKTAEAELIEDKQISRIKLRTLKLQNEQLDKEERAFADKKKALREEERKEEKEIVDTKLQAIRDENERIKAALNNREKERIAFLRRKQDIQTQEIEAEKEQDEKRKEAALENVRLLKKQLLKEEEKFNNDQKELRANRIQALKNEAEIIKAISEKREEEEIAILRRGQELKDKRREAEKIKDNEERELALENLRQKDAQLLDEKTDFFDLLSEQKAEQAELEAEFQAELDALSVEKRRMLQDAEIKELRETFRTKEKIRSKAVKKELINKRKENDLRTAEEERFGKTFAAINAFFRKDEFIAARTAASELVRLQTSKNETLKAIGKAAALYQIAIDTQRGMMAAYSSMAKFGLVGQIAGAALATALFLFGTERAAKVQAAQAGGMVAGTGFGDQVPFLLEPGELITPRQNFEEVISAVADQRVAQREAEEGTTPFAFGEEDEERLLGKIEVDYLSDEAADIVTVRQNEQSFLGISQRVS